MKSNEILAEEIKQCGRKIEETQNCKNCKYFVQHYRKGTTAFVKVNCGQCVNMERFCIKKKSPVDDGCKQWEKAEENREDTLIKLINRVKELDLKVAELCTVLSDYLGDLD